MSERILVIDDEPDLRELVRVNLDQAGFRVETAGSGREALASLRRAPPDLVILDLMLPDVSGTELCRKLRSDPSLGELPIIMLTAKSAEIDRIVGFELGADDYVTKPFSPRELVARVKGILRRARRPAPDPEKPGEVLRRGRLELDLDRHRCSFDAELVVLTVTEFGLLQSLCGMSGKVYTRDELVERAYGAGHHITDRTVDSHIRRIRQKFAAHDFDPIETVRGLGYRLREPGE